MISGSTGLWRWNRVHAARAANPTTHHTHETFKMPALDIVSFTHSSSKAEGKSPETEAPRPYASLAISPRGLAQPRSGDTPSSLSAPLRHNSRFGFPFPNHPSPDCARVLGAWCPLHHPPDITLSSLVCALKFLPISGHSNTRQPLREVHERPRQDRSERRAANQMGDAKRRATDGGASAWVSEVHQVVHVETITVANSRYE